MKIYLDCYCLVLKCPSTCYKDLVNSLWGYWEIVEPSESRASWKEVRSLGAWPWRGSWDPCSFLTLSLKWVALLHQMLPPCDLLLHHSPQNNSASWAWTEISETVSQNNPFPLVSHLTQVFCHSDGKLTSTILYNWIQVQLSVVVQKPSSSLCLSWAEKLWQVVGSLLFLVEISNYICLWVSKETNLLSSLFLSAITPAEMCHEGEPYPKSEG
jgi:hypothetical protein